MSSLLAKMNGLLILEQNSWKIEIKLFPLFHMKTRVSFRYFVSYCRYKNDHWFLFVTLYWVYNYKCQTNVFQMAKRYLVVIIMLFLFMKHNCFLCVGGWRVSMFSHLYFKCWQTRGRLWNSWNCYQKLHINGIKWSWRKMELEKNYFGEY